MNANLITRNLRVSRCNKAFLRDAIRTHSPGWCAPFHVFHKCAWKRRMEPATATNNYVFRFNLSGLVMFEVQA